MSDEITLGNISSLSSPATDVIARAAGPLIEGDYFFRELINALPAAVYTTDPYGRITYYNEEAPQRRASIVDSSDDANVSKDLDGIITSWNKGAERICGYMAEEIIGKSIKVLIPSEYHAEEDTILERIRRGQRIDHYETIRQRKHGSLINISLTVSPVRNLQGKIIGASKIARDITERKRSEAQISLLAREAEHRTKNILAAVQATVHLTQSETTDGLKSVIEGRIQAFANVHELFVQSGG